MADGLNKVMLIGNLGADPELKVTQGGQSMLKLRLATTETYLDRNGTKQERTDWHSVTIWGKRGEALSKFLAKGEKVYVEGRIQTGSYEKNGEKRWRTDIVATNIILLGRGRGGGDTAHEGGGGGQRAYGGGGGGASRTPSPPPADEPADAFAGGGSFDGDDEIPF